MTRRVYKWIDGKITQVSGEPPENSPDGGSFSQTEKKSAFIQTDTIMGGLRHPVTGKVYDSKSAYLKECDRLGLEVVGNDLLSRKPNHIPDRLTESVILDRIERAEAICSDPAKFRARQNENMERRERYYQLIESQRNK